MAMFVAKQSGDFNTAGTWNKTSTADGTALDNTTTTSFSATPRTSQTFTAPDLVSQCIGGVFWASIPNGWTGTFTFELLESGVVKATESVAYTALRYRSNQLTPIYIKFTTPYTYATLTANAYTLRLTAPATGGTGSIGAVSTTPGMLAVDDRTGAPGTSDDVCIVGECRAGADVVVTASGTVQFGGNIRTSAQSNFGSNTLTFRGALIIGLNGDLAADTAVTTTITINGQASLNDGGKLTLGTDASPATFANPLIIEFSKAQPNGLWMDRGILNAVGTARDVRRVYASGAGTAADPLILSSAANWAVDDEIVVTEVGTSATNYNNCQYRFIKTVNSTTSFVVSATAGGAESALTNTRTYAGGNSHIVNLQRSVKIGGKSGTGANVPVWILGSNSAYTNGYLNRYTVNMKNFRLEDVSQADFSAKGGGSTGASGQYPMYVDGMVGYLLTSGVTFRTNDSALADSFTFTGNTLVNQTAATTALTITTTFVNFTDFNLIDLTRGATSVAGFSFGIADNWVIASQNKSGASSVTTQMFSMSGTNTGGVFTNADVYASRLSPVNNNSGAVNPEFNGCNFGIRGTLNGATAVVVTANGPPTYLTNCNFQSSFNTFNYFSGAGAVLAVVNPNGVNKQDFYYDPLSNYKLEPTGTGLSDTTARTAGSYAVRVYASGSTAGGGMSFYSFNVLAEPNKAVSIFGYAKKAAALVGRSCQIRLTLPFATAPAATATLTDDTNWNLWALSANYSGTLTSMARVDVLVPFVASGYLYLDDIYNGTNVLTSFDMIHRAQPAAIMSNTLGDPNAVWQVLRSSATTAGTFGEYVNANIKLVNDVTVQGTGASGNEWGPA